MEPSEMGTAARWPESPYKGLTYYTAEDAVLFAGRDDDIVRCARLLAEWKMRLLLLHGATGCGKSSFLRAGLIPFLEDASAGIAFARAEHEDRNPVVFVRCTSDPVRSLADAVYKFANREVTQTAPDGELTGLPLRDALPAESAHDAAAFRRICGDDPDILMDVLRKLSGMVPETLVLIIDQAEEVLTVDLSGEGEKCRNRFFEFLAGFVRESFDLKLLLALRTEYFGRFISRAQREVRGSGVGQYYLDALTNEQVVEAILRPTSTEPIEGLGAPRDHYRFKFGKDVIDTIIRNLDNAGTKLPAVQIVCTSLYDVVRRRRRTTIMLDDLDRLGGVEGSIERFIDDQIRTYAHSQSLEPGEIDAEVDLWKEVMYALTRAQPDGTVTTELKPFKTLYDELAKSRLVINDALRRFASEDIRLLRKVDVVKAVTGTLIPCYGLGHDTLGLVLQKWKLRAETAKEDLVPEFKELTEIEAGEERILDGVALCLSGAGYRAMLFHLGALWKLNDIGYLQKVDLVSAVSAGAILGGYYGTIFPQLVFRNGAATNFEEKIVAPIRAFASRTIDTTAMLTSFLTGRGGAGVVASRFEKLFGYSSLQEWPEKPRIIVSATNMQCGSLFRFSRRYLADYRLGTIVNPTLSVATAVAASAAMPPMLSPMVLSFPAHAWSALPIEELADPKFRSAVQLTDGGIYDHYAIEPAWKRYRTILVSDGGSRRHDIADPSTNWAAQFSRMFELVTNNVRNLRRRQVIGAFVAGQRDGAYWSIGSRIEHYTSSGIPASSTWMNGLDALPVRYATIDEETQQRLINWGYAICDAAMRTHMGAGDGPLKLPYRISSG